MEAHGIHKILVDVRKILEATNLKKTYPTVALYCNWLLHQELSFKVHWPILERASKAIEKCCDDDTGQIVKELSNCFNINEFRNEIVDLFVFFKIDTSIFTIEENWRPFFSCLLQRLISQPISVGDKIFGNDGSTTYERARKLFKHQFRLIVVSLALEEKERANSTEIDVFWKARVEMPGFTTDKEHGVYLTGRLVS